MRKVRATVYSTVMVTFRRILARSGTSAAAYGGERPEWFDYPSGSRLWIAGIDDPGKALSAERDFIYVNQAEELSVADWEVLTTRATGRGAVTTTPMVFGDCNPGPPGHWIKARATAGHLTLLESRHQDNPSLWDGTAWTDQGRRTMETLDRLTGVRRLRLRDGLWVSAEGAVYEFDPAVHIIPRQPIPQEWTRIRSVDFGFTNPFACLWFAIDPDGRLVLYREIYMTRRTVRAHAEQINRLSAGERIEATVADHDAEDRATLAEAGIHTVAADKAISPGIQSVEARLAPAADGRPRLLVMEGSLVERDETLAAAHLPVCTRDEFDVYVWPKDSAGKAIKETPVDLHNHSMDCLRYAVRWADRFARAAASPAPKFRGPPIHDRMSRPDRHQFR